MRILLKSIFNDNKTSGRYMAQPDRNFSDGANFSEYPVPSTHKYESSTDNNTKLATVASCMSIDSLVRISMECKSPSDILGSPIQDVSCTMPDNKMDMDITNRPVMIEPSDFVDNPGLRSPGPSYFKQTIQQEFPERMESELVSRNKYSTPLQVPRMESSQEDQHVAQNPVNGFVSEENSYFNYPNVIDNSSLVGLPGRSHLQSNMEVKRLAQNKRGISTSPLPATLSISSDNVEVPRQQPECPSNQLNRGSYFPFPTPMKKSRMSDFPLLSGYSSNRSQDPTEMFYVEPPPMSSTCISPRIQENVRKMYMNESCISNITATRSEIRNSSLAPREQFQFETPMRCVANVSNAVEENGVYADAHQSNVGGATVYKWNSTISPLHENVSHFVPFNAQISVCQWRRSNWEYPKNRKLILESHRREYTGECLLNTFPKSLNVEGNFKTHTGLPVYEGCTLFEHTDGLHTELPPLAGSGNSAERNFTNTSMQNIPWPSGYQWDSFRMLHTQKPVLYTAGPYEGTQESSVDMGKSSMSTMTVSNGYESNTPLVPTATGSYVITFPDSNYMLKFKCQICEYEIHTKSHLEKHLQMHRERPFQCNICRFTFSHSSHLIRHKRKHAC